MGFATLVDENDIANMIATTKTAMPTKKFFFPIKLSSSLRLKVSYWTYLL
jgi:hypothetical protein